MKKSVFRGNLTVEDAEVYCSQGSSILNTSFWMP